jgi:hypothetical protein
VKKLLSTFEFEIRQPKSGHQKRVSAAIDLFGQSLYKLFHADSHNACSFQFTKKDLFLESRPRGHIPIFGRTKVQGIIDHFPPASPSSHASLSRQLVRRSLGEGGSPAAAEARRRRIAH